MPLTEKERATEIIGRVVTIPLDDPASLNLMNIKYRRIRKATEAEGASDKLKESFRTLNEMIFSGNNRFVEIGLKILEKWEI